ncbi:hypothetical protein [Bradyrhizobium canariense]|uniref:Uncharacterized protein n=1 Tax=Bradyrhizobium canariense TaxID=255045 RepID=A0A1H1NY23_9BRAD|nr:hypothetical protein [Bradyrhizobium canariense]SDS03842.1 hypothetical protein SAMN05444158_0804 [Bradyrhizobium canariense]
MNWASATSFDQTWRSPAFPMWLTLAAAAFFGIIVLITLFRAEKSVANGALTVITLLAVGVAVAATIRGFGPEATSAEILQSPPAVNATLPALSCVDDLAGETVLTACEKVLFGSAESAAAAVSYAASRLTQLTSFGDVATADKKMTPELQAIRRAIERDRYGLVAYVLLTRDHCTPSECAAFRSLPDHNQIVANMDERVYDGLIARYALLWNAPAVAAGPVAAGGAVGALAALPPSVPTGRPTNADFPSAASIPPVSIMSPEPGTKAAPATPSPPPRAPAATANAPSPPRQPQATASIPATAKKPAAKPRTAAPVQITPATPAEPAAAPAAAPAASND